MPVITLKIGNIQQDKKKELIEKLTKTASDITSIPAESYVVFIEEYEHASIGVGGRVLSEIIKNK